MSQSGSRGSSGNGSYVVLICYVAGIPIPAGALHRQPVFVDNTLVYVSRSREVKRPDGRFDTARGVVASYQPDVPAPTP